MNSNQHTPSTPSVEYHSLSEIRRRKAALLGEIRKENKHINSLWKNLFTPSRPSRRKRGFSMQSLMGTGMGVLDGALLAWKLYRKFKR